MGQQIFNTGQNAVTIYGSLKIVFMDKLRHDQFTAFNEQAIIKYGSKFCDNLCVFGSCRHGVIRAQSF